MLPFPFNLLNVKVKPILGKSFKGLPMFMPLDESSEYVHLLSKSQQEFQKDIDRLLDKNKTNWAVSGYLENRTTLLKDCPQMIREKRLYHLGVDITAPLGAKVYAPLNCTVIESGYEEGKGNYGGFVILKCCENGTTFYLLLGHLNPDKLPAVGSRIVAGKAFAELGDFAVNGDWFYHLHLQVLTEKALAEGWKSKGYCTAADIPSIDLFCPSPYRLLV